MSTGLRVSIGRVANSIVYLQKWMSWQDPKGSFCFNHCCFWRCCKVLQTGQAGRPQEFDKIKVQKSKRKEVLGAIPTNHKTQQSEMNSGCWSWAPGIKILTFLFPAWLYVSLNLLDVLNYDHICMPAFITSCITGFLKRQLPLHWTAATFCL